MDIVITLPSSIDWEDYQREIDRVKDESEVLNFRVPSLPAQTAPGERCYLVWRGNVIGWMKIHGFREGEFTCTTTGHTWKGKFIQRTGPLNRVDPVPVKGFRGFRYVYR